MKAFGVIGKAQAWVLVMMAVSSLADSAVCAGPGVPDPLVLSSIQLTAPDGSLRARFGQSVAVSGNTAVVGAPSQVDPVSGLLAGAAYVFVKTGTTWTLQAKLVGSDTAPGDRFGWSVALSGNTAVVGAFGHRAVGHPGGAAYVFVKTGTTWTQQAELTIPDPTQQDSFGEAVAIDGDTVVVGAGGHFDAVTGEDTGAAYVFVRQGKTWTFQAELTASDKARFDLFGSSVDVSGDTVVVGANSHANQVPFVGMAGAAYVFVRQGTNWTQQAELTASDKVEDDHFGWSLAISGRTVVVGSPNHGPVPDVFFGAAYVFVRQGTSWTQQAELTAENQQTNDLFGLSVDISGNTVVVGAPQSVLPLPPSPGNAYMFVRHGTTWIQKAELSASDAAAGDELGHSVAISGKTIVVGAPAHDSSAGVEDAGAAYVYPPKLLLHSK